MTELVWGSERGAEVYFIFRQKADVANLQRVLARGLAKPLQSIQRFPRGWWKNEVLCFIGIVLQIVKFLGGAASPEHALRRVQFAFVKELLPHLCRLGLKHVIDMLPRGQVRHVVAQVDVTT